MFRAGVEPGVVAGRGQRLSFPHFAPLAALLTSLLSAPGCAPTIAIEAPREPIVINMNIKVEHEIRISIDQDLEELFEEEKELF
jgi:hypothetical protein